MPFLKLLAPITFSLMLLACSSSVSTSDNADIVLVLDLSGSLTGSTSAVKTALKDGFVDQLADGNGGDRLGVVLFATGSVIQEPIDRTAQRGFNRTQVVAAIDTLTAGGWTATSDAIRKAFYELRAAPTTSQSKKRAIVLFADGAPNILPIQVDDVSVNVSRTGGTYDSDKLTQSKAVNLSSQPHIPPMSLGDIPTNGRLPVDSTTPLNACGVTRSSRNATENIAQRARQAGVLIYTIGFGVGLDSIESPDDCGLTDDDTGSSLLRRLANVPNVNNSNPHFQKNEPSGVYCQAINPTDLQACFMRIVNDIRSEQTDIAS